MRQVVRIDGQLVRASDEPLSGHRLRGETSSSEYGLHGQTVLQGRQPQRRPITVGNSEDALLDAGVDDVAYGITPSSVRHPAELVDSIVVQSSHPDLDPQ